MTDMRRVHNSTLNPLVVSAKGRRVLGCTSDTIDISEPRAQKYINQGLLLLINTTPTEPVTRPEDEEPATKPADADATVSGDPAPTEPKATTSSATPQPADEAPAESPATTTDTKKSTTSK